MAKIWKEPYESGKHQTPPEYWGSIDDHLRAPALIPKDVIMVHVAAFTFQFLSIEQLRDCLTYFERKIHPSGRRKMPEEKAKGIHWEEQRWFERLPVHLREEPKRQKVVQALRQALQLVEESKL